MCNSKQTIKSIGESNCVGLHFSNSNGRFIQIIFICCQELQKIDSEKEFQSILNKDLDQLQFRFGNIVDFEKRLIKHTKKLGIFPSEDIVLPHLKGSQSVTIMIEKIHNDFVS